METGSLKGRVVKYNIAQILDSDTCELLTSMGI